MVRISITEQAFLAIASTLALGSVGFENPSMWGRGEFGVLLGHEVRITQGREKSYLTCASSVALFTEALMLDSRCTAASKSARTLWNIRVFV